MGHPRFDQAPGKARPLARPSILFRKSIPVFSYKLQLNSVRHAQEGIQDQLSASTDTAETVA